MVRYVHGDRLCKRATANLSARDLERARAALAILGDAATPEEFKVLGIEKMKGHEAAYEYRVGGQNRAVMVLGRDSEGPYFVVDNIGPHSIYDLANRNRGFEKNVTHLKSKKIRGKPASR